MTHYGAILMDAAWATKTYSRDDALPQRAEQQHYRTMKLHEIAALPVPDMAAKNCALFMWTISSHLEHAFHLFRIWDFEFKSVPFIWIKTKLGAAEQGSFFLDDAYDDMHPIGMGKWARQQAEIVIVATRGKPAIKEHGVRQLIISPRREHSRKPDEIYSRIERLVEGPYIEFFARQRWPGWDQHGDQADMFEVAA